MSASSDPGDGCVSPTLSLATWLEAIARMATVLGIAAAILAVAASGVAAGSTHEATEPPGGEVAGTVNGEPVLVSEVMMHLRPPPPRVGVAAPPGSRLVAFDEAVQIRLLADEAFRRGLEPTSDRAAIAQAQLVRALRHQELRLRGLDGEQLDSLIGETEARAFLDAHRLELAAIASAKISALVIEGDDADADADAEQLLARAASLDDEDFVELVLERSVDTRSKSRGGQLAIIDRHGHGLDPAVARVAIHLKTNGAVGLAQVGSRLYILRASNVELEQPVWSDELAAYLINLERHELQQQAIDELIRRLRAKAEVTVDHDVLDALPIPDWRTFAGPGVS